MFENIVKVEKANSKKRDKVQDFDLKYNPKTERFKFSEILFEELGLNYNSLVQYNVYDEENKGIYLNVLPDNTGIFMKKQGSKNKGREFKNDEIVNAISDIYKVDIKDYQYFSLEKTEAYNNYPMYKLVLDVDRYDRFMLNNDEMKEAIIESVSASIGQDIINDLEDNTNDDSFDV
jgi:hypothetical protein